MPDAPPQGSTPLPAAPAGSSPIQGAALLDHDTLKNLWLKAGGDSHAADMMAHIAEQESTGDPTRVNPDSGAAGLWQVNPHAHGEGNWLDPMVNARKAVDLYNRRRSLGETGYEDWADSKDKGASGGWGKFLPGAPPPPAPKEDPAKKATTTPTNSTPLPGDTGNMQKVYKPKNEDPRQGNYNIVESLAGHQELPFMLANAALWDKLDKTGGSHVAEVMNLWKPVAAGGKGSPGAASAIYGLNSPKVLDMYARSGIPGLAEYANLLKSNSWLAGGATFAEEWFNPLAWVEGGAVGKGIGGLLKGVKMVPGVSNGIESLMHMMSVYKPMVEAHGTGPRNVLATVGQRMSRGERQGHDAMMHVYGGFSPDEQLEIDRRSQNLTPDTKFKQDRSDLIDKSASARQEYVREQTAAKIASGALKKSQVHGVKGSKPTDLYFGGKKVASFDFDPGTYVGLADQYSHPNSGYNSLIEHLGLEGSGNPSIKHKTYDNLDEALADKDGKGPSLLRGDIDHASLFRNFMTTGAKRVEFEQGMRELAARHPDVISVPANDAEYDRLLSSGKMIPIRDVKRSGINIGNTGSPFMRQAFISPAFKEFLTGKSGMNALVGKSAVELGQASKAAQWANAYNQTYRASIVANPGYHPFWNVAPNAAAAADHTGPAGLANLMVNHTRALLGTGATVTAPLGHLPVVGGVAKKVTQGLDAAREGLEYPFIRGAQSYQDALHHALAAGAGAKEAHAAGRSAAEEEALSYGAGAEFGAPNTAWHGKPGAVFTRPIKDPTTGKYTIPANTPEFWDRMLTKADQWNQEGTFGKRGEQAFATTLFHQLYRKGGIHEGDPYAAAWATREALGNYRNIDPDNGMSKMILFFPWLASNVPFWFKSFTKTPSFVTAPTQASRTQRENAGDPTAYQADYPKLGISTYDRGSGTNRDIPLPFKDMERLAQGGYDIGSSVVPGANPAHGGFDQGEQEIEGEITSRMKPFWSTLGDTILTRHDEKANPPGSYVGYDVMYDKNEPEARNAQLLQSAGGMLAPLPFPFVVRDIIRQGYDPAKMDDYAQEALGMGYISERTADSFKKANQHNSAKLEKAMSTFRRVQAGQHPMTEDQAKAFVHGHEAAYEKAAASIKAQIDAAKKKAGLPPPGSSPLQGPPGSRPL